MRILMLDPQQQAAVDCDAPRILLQAGAGSGKTRTLVARIVRLLDKYHPREILALTFTRKAAAEMRERLAEAHPRGRYVPVTTFHSWAAGIIREFHDLVPIARDFSIRDEQDRDDLLKLCAVELGETGKKAGMERDLWATKPLHPATRKRLLADAKIMARYRDLMREAQALDYDGLETTLMDLLRQVDVVSQLRNRVLVAFVDEYQDTSLLQQAILDILNPRAQFAVGDPSQSIYAFRGACLGGFLALARRPDWRVLELATNYRSVVDVVHMANRCATTMAHPGIRMRCGRGGGIAEDDVAVIDWEGRPGLNEAIAESIINTRSDFAAMLHGGGGDEPMPPWSDFAVLSPTWDLLEELAETLRRCEIPCVVARKRLDVWESSEARWLLDVLRAGLNPWDHLATRSAMLAFSPRLSPAEWATARATSLRLGGTALDSLPGHLAPVRAIRRVLEARNLDAWRALPDVVSVLAIDLEFLHLPHRVANLAQVMGHVDLWRAANPDGTLQDLLTWYAARRVTDPEVDEKADALQLMTIHAAKGLEWPYVWVVGLEEGRLPRYYDQDDEAIEESRRLFYVALTRARDRLRLCVDASADRSRFLGGMLP
jgi:superfamily I DNA/RNA helicase